MIKNIECQNLVEVLTHIPWSGDKSQAPVLSMSAPQLTSGTKVLIHSNETTLIILKKVTDLIKFEDFLDGANPCTTVIYLHVTEWRQMMKLKWEGDRFMITEISSFSDATWNQLFRKARHEAFAKGLLATGAFESNQTITIPSLDVEEWITVKADKACRPLFVRLLDKNGNEVWRTEDPVDFDNPRQFYLGANVRGLQVSTLTTDENIWGVDKDRCFIN